MSRAPVRFLLVEDDPDHAWLVGREFELHREDAELARVDDAEQALAYLKGEEPFAGRPRPDVVLIDLNLPGRSGFELLSTLRTEPRGRGLRTVVLTTSSSGADRLKAAPLADGFITKPLGLMEFRRAIGGLIEHWVEVCHGSEG